MNARGPLLAVIGALIVVIAAAQHSFALVPITHLALYLAALGLAVLLPGVWLSFRRHT
jgi:hypothetical protein